MAAAAHADAFAGQWRRTLPQIKLEAKPLPIAVDTAKAALIVVDTQNDFGSKGGLFDHAGVDITSIQKVVPATARAIAAARKTGIKVIFLKMGFRPDLSDMGSDDAPNRVRHLHFGAGQPMKTPDGREGRFLVRDTWGTAIVPELRPAPGDIEIWKTRFSGFYETELDSILKSLGAARRCAADEPLEQLAGGKTTAADEPTHQRGECQCAQSVRSQARN